LARQVVIEGGQAHYLARVMRIAPGDAVVLCDDQTGEWAARVTEAGKREVLVTCEVLLRPREQVPDFTLCAALLKKDRFDLVLEKALRAGGAANPAGADPALRGRQAQPGRARAVLIEAAEQCARTALPELAAPVKLDALLRNGRRTAPCFLPMRTAGKMLRSNLPHARAPPRC
jgi:16S rRNA (uracil1498-N3)-methyltransferase